MIVGMSELWQSTIELYPEVSVRDAGTNRVSWPTGDALVALFGGAIRVRQVRRRTGRVDVSQLSVPGGRLIPPPECIKRQRVYKSPRGDIVAVPSEHVTRVSFTGGVATRTRRPNPVAILAVLAYDSFGRRETAVRYKTNCPNQNILAFRGGVLPAAVANAARQLIGECFDSEDAFAATHGAQSTDQLFCSLESIHDAPTKLAAAQYVYQSLA